MVGKNGVEERYVGFVESNIQQNNVRRSFRNGRYSRMMPTEQVPVSMAGTNGALPALPYIDPRASFHDPMTPGRIREDEDAHFIQEHGKDVHMSGHVYMEPKEIHSKMSKSSRLQQKTVAFRVMTKLDSQVETIRNWDSC